MFGHVVAVEPGPIIGFDEFQPLLVEKVQRRQTTIHMIEDTKFHLRNLMLSPPRDNLLLQAETLGLPSEA